MKRSITIIDHTGVKSGMDKYSISLGRALVLWGCKVLIFSNFKFNEGPALSVFKVFEPRRSFIVKRLAGRIYGYIRAVVKTPKGNDYIFIHLFELSIISFLQHFICYHFGNGRIVTIYHDLSAFGKKDIKGFAYRMLNKYSRYIIVHNHFSKSSLISLYPYLHQDKVIVMKHGNYLKFSNLNDEPVASDIVDIHHLKLTGKKVLLFFGQIKHEKGLDILLQSMRDVPANVILVIAGSPVVNFQQYHWLIKELGIEDRVVFYLRFIKDFEMNYLMRSVDLIVLPYKQIYQSGVLLDVLSHKALILASDLEPNKEIIEDGANGFLFKTGYAKSLSDKVNYILNVDPLILQAIKIAGYETVKKHHDWDLVTAPLVEQLFELQ